MSKYTEEEFYQKFTEDVQEGNVYGNPDLPKILVTKIKKEILAQWIWKWIEKKLKESYDEGYMDCIKKSISYKAKKTEHEKIR